MRKIIAFVKKYWNLIMYFLLLLLSILIPIVINRVVFAWRSPYAHGELGDWIGFIGNYMGGIIGGVVAFIVVNKELRFQRSQDQINKVTKQMPIFTDLILELGKISMQFKELRESPNYKAGLIPTFSTDQFIEERWSGLNLIEDYELRIELVKFLEAYKRTVEVFAFNTDDLEITIKEKILILNEIEKRITFREASDHDYLSYKRIQALLDDLTLELQMYKREKVEYWNQIDGIIMKVEGLEGKLTDKLIQMNRMVNQ